MMNSKPDFINILPLDLCTECVFNFHQALHKKENKGNCESPEADQDAHYMIGSRSDLLTPGADGKYPGKMSDFGMMMHGQTHGRTPHPTQMNNRVG